MQFLFHTEEVIHSPPLHGKCIRLSGLHVVQFGEIVDVLKSETSSLQQGQLLELTVFKIFINNITVEQRKQNDTNRD